MITSVMFTDTDVSSTALPKAVEFCASLLCRNALDELASEFGKPEILCWYVPESDLISNPYTRQLWEDYRVFNGLEDNGWEREKFAVTVCPYLTGACVLVRFKDPKSVYAYSIARDTVKIDAMVMDADTLMIYSKLGIGRAFLDKGNIPQPTESDDVIDPNAVEVEDA